MFHVKRRRFKMVYVKDFCSTCSNGTRVKLMFFKVESQEFMTTIDLYDAQNGVDALSATYAYGTIESLYNGDGIIICKVLV